MNFWLNLFLIGIAGACGALLRHGVSAGIRSAWGDHFPLGTLLVNAIGCFLLGLMVAYLDEKTSKGMREILGVGFLGALTTFSTFGVETVNKAQQGQLTHAALNVLLNLVLGFALAAIGIWIGRSLAGD